MNIHIERAELCGRVRVCSSKSYVQRALICAALSDSCTRLWCTGAGEDISACADCLKAMGVGITETNDGYTVTPMLSWKSRVSVNAGESASALRFLLPLLCMFDGADVCGGESLSKRPIKPLTDCLEKHGARFRSNKLPLLIDGGLVGGSFEIPADVSSQFVSGLLLALPVCGGSVRPLTQPVSAPYIAMTIRTMRDFGVTVEKEDGVYITRGSYSSPGDYFCEGDWSAAAYLLTAGLLGGSVTVSGLDPDSLQPDRAFCEIARSAGGSVCVTSEGVTARKSELMGFDADVTDCPDLAPALAVLAAAAKGRSVLRGVDRLRTKESDRVDSVIEMLRSLGAGAHYADGCICIEGGGIKGGEVDGRGDHRIIMAAAAACGACPDGVTVTGAQAVGKSYPGFFEALGSLGGRSYVV